MPIESGRLIISSSSTVGASTASLSVEGSGSSVFTVDGTNGRLFSVTDEMSGSIFSANLISGLPVIEAFSDNKVTLGQFASPIIVETNADSNTIISGSSTSTGSFGLLQVAGEDYVVGTGGTGGTGQTGGTGGTGGTGQSGGTGGTGGQGAQGGTGGTGGTGQTGATG